jgi:hypothetical protein
MIDRRGRRRLEDEWTTSAGATPQSSQTVGLALAGKAGNPARKKAKGPAGTALEVIYCYVDDFLIACEIILLYWTFTCRFCFFVYLYKHILLYLYSFLCTSALINSHFSSQEVIDYTFWFYAGSDDLKNDLVSQWFWMLWWDINYSSISICSG